MTISKRIRFEILRRDDNTCQYCGRKAPDVPLHIDHVVPVALGGSDAPSNLLTACSDCNTGKASIQPDGPLVSKISDHAAAYALGMLDKMTRLRADLEREQRWADEFEEMWNDWYVVGGPLDGKPMPLPPHWEQSVARWYSMGVPEILIRKAIKLAMEKRGLRGEFSEFAYMAGVIWRSIDAAEIDYDLVPEHAAVATQSDLEDARADAWTEGFRTAWDKGYQAAAERHETDALLVSLIDRRAEARDVA